MRLKLFFLSLFIAIASLRGLAQDDVVTPGNARQKMKEQHDQEEKKYLEDVKKHQDKQGKAGKKRMKKHLKQSQKLRKTQNLPWYRRLFRRRK